MLFFNTSNANKKIVLQHRVFLSIGANLSDRAKNIFQAINLLNQSGVYVNRISDIFETTPMGKLSVFNIKLNFRLPNFLNCVAEAVTNYQPYQLLLIIHRIERILGRKRIVFIKNLPRTIDIDILFYDDKIIDELKIKIPHPRICQRAFVLVPLCEIAPDLIHPQYHNTIQNLTNLVDKKGVKIWQQPTTILS